MLILSATIAEVKPLETISIPAPIAVVKVDPIRSILLELDAEDDLRDDDNDFDWHFPIPDLSQDEPEDFEWELTPLSRTDREFDELASRSGW